MAASNRQEADDLDDLDDLLDDFDNDASEPIPTSGTALATGSSASRLTELGDVPEESESGMPALESGDFAQQLQMGMEDLMKELEASPEAKKDFEQLMEQMSLATADGAAGDAAKSVDASKKTSYPNNAAKKAAAVSAKSDGKPKNFQETLEANLARIRESERSAKNSNEQDDSAGLEMGEGESDAFMAEMMKQFEQSAGENGDFGSVLEGMMAQLMSKEILYEPLLELSQKYPDWIKEHPEDPKLETYKKQCKLVQQIVAEFDSTTYNDDDKAKKDKVMALMGEMQELGSPPTEIMGEDLGMLDGGMPKMTEDCTIM
ncbi:Pex19 protein family-domain-containing protein [Protomyces lactucae-debilis]|uniref:Pex19 protein family-domain-containing protein n=1 Tax=Protomyces lactucae-debilis TaxID=2754530 RepID=A0A1Y2FK60_PROLT|nr:Pex19 protein family-domain-containing protein [Protomyces lactucae-debilis]ORY83175.1 Pex19 protein family-domain-containing protein [Protomyces lactucae-debilis]